MEPANLAPDDDSHDSASDGKKPLRLGDAERIAAERLEAAGMGSPTDPLAMSSAERAEAAAVGSSAPHGEGRMDSPTSRGVQPSEPLTGALNAAVKLAAEAKFAAAALES